MMDEIKDRYEDWLFATIKDFFDYSKLTDKEKAEISERVMKLIINQLYEQRN